MTYKEVPQASVVIHVPFIVLWLVYNKRHMYHYWRHILKSNVDALIQQTFFHGGLSNVRNGRMQ